MTKCLPEAFEALVEAKRPVVLLGPVERATAKRVAHLARLCGAALLLTPDAMSLVDGTETVGIFSFGASDTAREVVALSDTVLAFCALDEFQCRLGKALEGRTVIHVTPDASDIGRNLFPAVSWVGDIDDIASALAVALGARAGAEPKPWFRELLRAGPVWQGGLARPGVIHPVAAIRAIESALPARCRIALEVTSGALHAYQGLRPTTEQRVFSSIEKSACMGEALMSSLGIRLASGLPTLVIAGDWCQCMTPAEIHAAVEAGVDRHVVVVWSNGGGAFIGEGIRQQQHRIADAAWSFRCQPRFALMAEAFHAFGVRVTDAAALEAAVREGMRASRPMIVDVAIDPSVPVPAGDRFLTLGQSHG